MTALQEIAIVFTVVIGVACGVIGIPLIIAAVLGDLWFAVTGPDRTEDTGFK